MNRISAALTGAAAVLAACQDWQHPTEPPSLTASRQAATPTGSVHVSVATSGVDLDPNGYVLSVDGHFDRLVAANGSVTIDALPMGKHEVALVGVASNCTLPDPAPRVVHVRRHRIREIGFVLTCATALPAAIAFASERSGNSEIYVMGADGSGVTKLTDDPRLDLGPAWSPDGATIAFTRDVSPIPDFEQLQIVAMNADGSNVRRLTDSLHLDSGPLAWSPDGRRIAFTSDGDGSNLDIYLMNPDGSGVTRLTDHRAADVEPTWSPDGRKIVFRSDRDGNSQLYVMNADGSGVTQLTNDVPIEFSPAWSPDGSKTAFERAGEIYVMNPDGSGVTKLTDNPAFDGRPAWSPDGTRIAFHSNRDGNFEIYVMAADGSGVTRVTNDPGRDVTAAWAPPRRAP